MATKVLLYTFIIMMLLEAFVHSTQREGMLTADEIIAELEDQAMGGNASYEDEDEY